MHVTQKVKFNQHKHAKSDWITQGIIKSIQFRDNLYVKLKQTQTYTLTYITQKTNLKTYNKILKRNIEQAKRIYYEHRFNKYKNDAKNTWKVIKELINRNVAKKQKPCRFKVDDKILTEEHEIANAFNKYFTNIGPSLASNIKTDGDKTFDYFLGRPRALKFTFNQITETDVFKIIDGLPSKNSSGIDDISQNLLKSIKHEIGKPITLIINQCFQKGIFPDKLKIAKVVPICKCNDETELNNYRPISVLKKKKKKNTVYWQRKKRWINTNT